MEKNQTQDNSVWTNLTCDRSIKWEFKIVFVPAIHLCEPQVGIPPRAWSLNSNWSFHLILGFINSWDLKWNRCFSLYIVFRMFWGNKVSVEHLQKGPHLKLWILFHHHCLRLDLDGKADKYSYIFMSERRVLTGPFIITCQVLFSRIWEDFLKVQSCWVATFLSDKKIVLYKVWQVLYKVWQVKQCYYYDYWAYLL